MNINIHIFICSLHLDGEGRGWGGEMNITIHIERLILDGLPVTRSHGPLVEAAVKAELARLLATDGLNPELQVGGAVPLLKASNIQIGSEGNPNQLGQQIAQAVHGGIGR